MKKVGIILSIILIAIPIFYFQIITAGANEIEPKTYYNVYLDGDLIGTIKSKKELENYIDTQNEIYKQQYNIDTVYAPNGLDIKSEVVYENKVDSVEYIYKKIQNSKPFTIKGYQYTIKSSYVENEETFEESGDIIEESFNTNENEENNDSNDIKIYVINKDVFTDSIETFIKTYAGDEAYEAYKTKTQKQIETTGTIIENVYLKNNITFKEVNIPITEKIYIDKNDLSKFLLFGPEIKQTEYSVLDGDTIETISFNNKISTQEFLLSNPTFKNVNNLLFPGQVVTIGITNPQIQIVVKQFTVEDVQSDYKTEIKYDSTKVKGDNYVEREGENGLNRVSRELEITNGIVTNTTVKNIEELKPSISKIMVYGDKIVPNIGTGSWAWPTNQGYIITSPYGYRVDPINGSRSLHTGLDIAGTGAGSPIYAADNGTVVTAEMHRSYGNYVVINHNNGYYTSYAHMQRLLVSVGDTVANGQKIGLMGSTGRSTGPHLHLELWYGGAPFRGGTRMNPMKLYR